MRHRRYRHRSPSDPTTHWQGQYWIGSLTLAVNAFWSPPQCYLLLVISSSGVDKPADTSAFSQYSYISTMWGYPMICGGHLYHTKSAGPASSADKSDWKISISLPRIHERSRVGRYCWNAIISLRVMTGGAGGNWADRCDRNRWPVRQDCVGVSGQALVAAVRCLNRRREDR